MCLRRERGLGFRASVSFADHRPQLMVLPSTSAALPVSRTLPELRLPLKLPPDPYWIRLVPEKTGLFTLVVPPVPKGEMFAYATCPVMFGEITGAGPGVKLLNWYAFRNPTSPAFVFCSTPPTTAMP